MLPYKKYRPKGLTFIKKIGIIMSILMGVTLSFFMSLLGTLTSGHFTVISWLISFGISLVISLIIGFIVPMQRIEAAACRKAKLRPGTLPATLLSALISNTIYTPIMSVVMSVIMITASTSGLRGEIARTEYELDSVNATIASVNEELERIDSTDPAKAGDLRSKLGELTGQAAGLSGKLTGMKQAEPNMGMAILISLLVCYPAGYVVIVIVQPLYLKMLLKKLGPPHGAHGMPPGGRPPEGMPPGGRPPEGMPPRDE